MFIKKILNIKSGNGGNGLISFLKFKNKMLPNGGNGGDGGDVYITCNNNCKIFSRNNYNAENGNIGKKKKHCGKKGKHLIIKFPIGSILEIENRKFYLINNNFFLKILNGGKGGLGNHNFKNYYNNKIATKGERVKFINCIFIYKFFVQNFIIKIENYKLYISNIKNNFISKIYLIFLNFNTTKILIKIIKFYLYFLYLKNFKNNFYWIIFNVNNKILFLKILNLIKFFIFPVFFVSKIFNFGFNKIIHYLFLWKNS
ncbi:GTPase [Candidatus Carsonella ruddii]|uniref:Putative GTPase n=1 Tax=Candidatus Carsonella ruddii PC isolate NHV TaxID=1202540 RepID=J3YQW2_CARRU|nr:GTPase [Candidatus Carsonella ruddii]AFP84358.1 putative GTPase [Candidatus Carsonella ruddii PC isolate NHV]